MPLLTPFKVFFVTADNTNLLANDQILGNLGRGRYRVTAIAAAAADATITINDGNTNVVDAAPIPVRAAAVTYPEIKKNEDRGWIVDFVGNGPNLIVEIADGTNGEITVCVEKIG